MLCMVPPTLGGGNSFGVTHGSIVHARKLRQRKVMLLNKRSNYRNPPVVDLIVVVGEVNPSSSEQV